MRRLAWQTEISVPLSAGSCLPFAGSSACCSPCQPLGLWARDRDPGAPASGWRLAAGVDGILASCRCLECPGRRSRRQDQRAGAHGLARGALPALPLASAGSRNRTKDSMQALFPGTVYLPQHMKQVRTQSPVASRQSWDAGTAETDPTPP